MVHTITTKARENERQAKESAAAAQLNLFLEHEDKCCEPGGYKRIYPNPDAEAGAEDKYKIYTSSVASLHSNTVRARFVLFNSRTLMGWCPPPPPQQHPLSRSHVTLYTLWDLN